MPEILTLTIIDFDSMENSASEAEHVTEEYYFIGNEEQNAHSKCCEFLRELSFKPYLGWNQEVYPKFIIKRKYGL